MVCYKNQHLLTFWNVSWWSKPLAPEPSTIMGRKNLAACGSTFHQLYFNARYLGEVYLTYSLKFICFMSSTSIKIYSSTTQSLYLPWRSSSAQLQSRYDKAISFTRSCYYWNGWTFTNIRYDKLSFFNVQYEPLWNCCEPNWLSNDISIISHIESPLH